MRATNPLVVAAALGLLCLDGCGSSSGSGNGEAGKDPSQVLADVGAALGQSGSFHVEGSSTDKDGPATLSGDVRIPGQLHITVHQGSSVLEVLLTGNTAYFKANRAFWESQANAQPSAVALLSDRWVSEPSTSPGFANLRVLADPTLINTCLVGKPHGTLSNSGTAKVGDQDALVISDAGDKPGTSPGQLYLATGGAPVPLRTTQTGPEKPGGTPNPACGDTKPSTTTQSDIIYSRYGQAAAIPSPPTDALDLSKLGGSGSG